MTNLMDKISGWLSTKKQTKKSDAVNRIEGVRRAARLDLEKAINDLKRARSKGKNGHGIH